MAVCLALLNRHLTGGCRVWCSVSRPLVLVRSAHVTESGARSDEEEVWRAAGYLPFSGSKIGSFFQEKPVLKNPFLEDALLRGYLSRHLPQQVRKKSSDVSLLLKRYYKKNDSRRCNITSVITGKGCHISCFSAGDHVK